MNECARKNFVNKDCKDGRTYGRKFFVRCRRTYVLDNTCINQVYKLHRKKYFDRFDLFFKNNI